MKCKIELFPALERVEWVFPFMCDEFLAIWQRKMLCNLLIPPRFSLSLGPFPLLLFTILQHLPLEFDDISRCYRQLCCFPIVSHNQSLACFQWNACMRTVGCQTSSGLASLSSCQPNTQHAMQTFLLHLNFPILGKENGNAKRKEKNTETLPPT